MRYFFLYVLLQLNFSLFAQETELVIDSLEKNAHRINSDPERLEKYIEWTRENEGKNYSVALHFGEKAVELAQKIGNKEREAYALNSLGNTYWYMNELQKCMNYYIKAMKIRDEIQDKRGMGTSRINIGSVLSEQGDFKNSKRYFDEALSIFKSIKNTEEECATLVNIAEWHYYQQEHDSAIYYYKKAKEIAIRDHYPDQVTQINNGLAGYFRRKDEIPKALELYEENIKIDKESGDIYSLTVTLNNLSLAQSAMGDYKKAIETSLQSLELAQQIDNHASIQYALGNLAEYYKQIGDYKNAYQYQNYFLAYFQESVDAENKRIGLEIEARFQDEKKQLQIDRLKEKEKLQQEEIRNKEIEADSERKTKIMFGGGFLFVLLIAVLIFRSLRQNQKTNRIILAQKKEVEHQKELIEDKNKEILDSINYARRLQDAIIPSLRAIKEHLPGTFVLYRPKDIVAGDFYWMEKTEKYTYFAVADCTGHGVPGALVSVVCANALDRTVKEFGIEDTGKILDHTRSLILKTFSKSEDEVKDGMDISLVRIDNNNQLQWSGANNPLYIIRNGSESIEEMQADKFPVGAGYADQQFQSKTISITKGDQIYLFTDGFADQFGGENGKKLKSSGLKKLLLSIHHLSSEEQVQTLSKTFENWKGNLEQIDDVCLAGIRF